jgi:hypothetical protein
VQSRRGGALPVPDVPAPGLVGNGQDGSTFAICSIPGATQVANSVGPRLPTAHRCRHRCRRSSRTASPIMTAIVAVRILFELREDLDDAEKDHMTVIPSQPVEDLPRPRARIAERSLDMPTAEERAAAALAEARPRGIAADQESQL